MARKVFLDWEDVQQNWENLDQYWEDVYILITSGGGSQYFRDNPWDKPWNKPEWQNLTESEKSELTKRYNSKLYT